jgi:uncharacterized membrane protein YjjP (DUF1212 family)
MHSEQTELLACAGRLLLEYNESTGEIHRALAPAARKLTSDKFHVAVAYGGIVVSLGDEPPLLRPVRELRYNAALQANIHSILDRVCCGDIGADQALELMIRVEAETPRHSSWLVALVLGVAGAALAALLGADVAGAAAAGIGTALGLLARRELGRRHWNLLALPLTAALIGAVLSGIAIRLGWTNTPGLALIVPSLMLIPGPHLINALLDLVDNFIPMSVARIGLATAIIAASALGVVLGIELTLPSPPAGTENPTSDHLNLFTDILLAGVVTGGFALFYNAAWNQAGLAILGGMAGHGTRFIALEAGCRLEVATLLGGLAVGIVTALIARSQKVPFAVVAFAGAVTMMPSIQIYRTLGGTLRLARWKDSAELPTISSFLGNASQACLVAAALALGLIVAERAVTMFAKEKTYTPT